MREFMQRTIAGGRDGLGAGLDLGIVHAAILATAGLYNTSALLEIVFSFARYAGLVGLIGGAAGILIAVATRLLPGMRSRRRGGVFGLALFVFYGLTWGIFLLKQAIQSRVTLAIVGGLGTLLVLVALYAVMASLRVGRRDAARGSAPIGGFIGLLVLAVALYAFPKTVPDRPAADTDDAIMIPPSERLVEEAKRAFTERRWNVLLLTVDTLRADRLGCYGYGRPTSPAIDSLASEGVRFEHAICQRPKTSPSFATILTGTYPAHHGIHDALQLLKPSSVTLAEVLGDAGWTTAAVITNGNLYPDFGFDQGFETYAYGHKDAGTGTALSLDWLDANGTMSEPWFLWVHHTDPHTPYDPPKEYEAMFAEPSGAVGAAFESSDSVAHRRQCDLYDAEIRYTADQMGRILRWIAKNNMRDRTLIVFTADHGESLGEHGYYYEHGLHPYDASGRIPLIISAPGAVPAGVVSPALVGGVDILPTLMDALGLPQPEDVQGMSALPAVVGLTEDGPREFVFLEAGYGPHNDVGYTRALRRHDTKYVQRLTGWARLPETPVDFVWTFDARVERGLQADEFYDLRADPGETVNLLNSRSDLARRERETLAAFASQLLHATMASIDDDPTAISPEALESLRGLGYID